MVSYGGGQGHRSLADSGTLTTERTHWVGQPEDMLQAAISRQGNGEYRHPEGRVSFKSARGQRI